MAFKSPDLTGPRYRKNFKRLLSRDLYNRFIKENPQDSSFSYEKFKAIIVSHSEKMWKVAINERDGIELPMGGVLFIGSVKIYKKNNYDIKASIAANAPIKHRNYDTDGHVAKIYYSSHLSKIGGKDRSIWSFKGGRKFKRTLAKEYPSKWIKYSITPNMHKISRDFHKSMTKSFAIERTRRTISTYNEFNLD